MQINIQEIENIIFNVNPDNFVEIALQVFRFQAQNNKVYQEYLHHLNVKINKIDALNQIPFLPIEFFKNYQIKTTHFEPEIIFTSSGTSGMETSRHLVKKTNLYHKSFTLAFEKFYGKTENWCVLALLPAYLEREGSSLVYMVEDFIKKSGHQMSGFYLNDYDKLVEVMMDLNKKGQKILLLGVSFALWDLAEKYDLELGENFVIMETGGMKGRRKEIVRNELHEIFKNGFGVKKIHSEYGMTELLSQSYSKGDGVFECPKWMRILVRDVTDPFNYVKNGQSGCLNVIDLANLYSCSFIATSDLGKCYDDGRFEVLGRVDSSDVRGCNLMVF